MGEKDRGKVHAIAEACTILTDRGEKKPDV